MPLAETNRVQLRYAAESTWGEAVANGPATTEVRITSESLAHQKSTIVSQEIRTDRQRTALLEVGVSAAGDFGFELSYGSMELFAANALRTALVSTVTGLASATVAASSITGPTGTTFLADGFTAGQFIMIESTGNTHNGVVAQIDSLTELALTIVGTTLTASVLASAAINGRTIVNGTTKTSYFMEAGFADITAVKYFTGMRAASMSMDLQSGQIVTGVFSFMGKEGSVASVTVASTVVTSANQTTAMTAAANVLNVFEAGVDVGVAVQGFNISLENNMRERPQVGQKYTADPGDGGVDVTGNLNVYFENISQMTKFINHTATSLACKMKDVDGNYIIVSVPAVYFSTGDPGASGPDSDVFLSMDFTAIKDATKGYTIRVDFLPAA